MNLAVLLHREPPGRLPPDLLEQLRGADEVVSAFPLEGFPGRLRLLPDLKGMNPLKEWEYTDRLATRTAGALRRDGRPLEAPEREAYRTWMQSVFNDEWLPRIPALAEWLDGHAGQSAVKEVRAYVEYPLFERLLRRLVVARGLTFRPLKLASGAGHVRRHGDAPFARWRERLRAVGRAVHGWLVRARRWGGRVRDRRVLRRLSAGNAPIVLFYLTTRICEKILGRAMRLLIRDGYAVGAVVMPSDPGLVPTRSLPCPHIWMWSLETLPDPAEAESRLDLAEAELPDDLRGCEQELRGYLVRYAWPEIRRQVATHHRIWSLARPAAVVMADDYFPAAGLGLAARTVKIPSLACAHGASMAFCRNYGFTYNLLYGPELVNVHTGFETPPPECTVTSIGAFRFDSIFRREYPGADQIRRQLRVGPDAPLVCYAASRVTAQHSGQFRIQALDWLREALPPEAVLVVKKHPLQEGRFCEEYLAARIRPDRYRVIQEEVDLHGLLAASRLLVTEYSSTITEAVCLQTPLIIIENPEVHDAAHFPLALCRLVGDAAAMRAAVGEFLAKGNDALPAYAEERRRYIQGYLFSDDGLASERLVQLIKDSAAR